MNWELHYYPQHDGSWPDPGPGKRDTDMGFMVSCDAECDECGFTQHPPTGGECPCCGAEGKIDFSRVVRERG